MATVQELSVQLSADTATFNVKMDRAEANIDEVTQSMLKLAGSSEMASEQMDDASRSALFLGGSMSSLAASTLGARTAFGGMRVITVLSLIPALITLSTVLAPLIGIMGVLATSAVALGGALLAVPILGMIGHTQELKVALQAVSDQLLEVTKPLRDVFFQALLQVIHDLPMFVESIIDAAGGAETFADMFLKLWSITKRIVPPFIGFMTDLAIRVFPDLVNVINWLAGNAPGAFQGMSRSMTRLMPVLRDLFNSLVDFMPVLLRFGTNVALVVIPALADMIDALSGVMHWINQMPPGIRSVVIGFTILLPVLTTIATTFGGLILTLGSVATSLGTVASAAGTVASAIGSISAVALGVGAVIVGLAAAWITNWKDIRGFTDTVTSSIVAMLQDVIGTARDALELLNLVDARGGNRISDAIERGQRDDISTGYPGMVTPETRIGEQQPVDVNPGIGRRGPMVNVERIEASSESGGREAARGLTSELRSQNVNF